MSWTMKRFRINRWIALVLLFSLVSCSGVVLAGQTVVKPGQIKFVLASRPAEDIPADNPVEFRRQGNEKQDADIVENSFKNREPVYYYATELADSHGHIIPAEYLLAKTPYDSAYQPLINDILVLAQESNISTIQFKLAKEAWGPKGVYRGWLRSSLGRDRDIRVMVHIKAWTSIALDSEDVTITAANGPGTYSADNPVTITVYANHRDWNLTLSCPEPLEFTGEVNGDPPVLEQENLFVAVEQPDADYHQLSQPLNISGTSYGGGSSFDLYFKAKTEWKHSAGIYRGKIDLLLSSTCSDEEDEELLWF